MAEGARRNVGLGLILVVLAATLAIGVAIRQPCATGPWDGQQYTRLCYTDLIPLYGTEHLEGGRLPYLDACPDAEGNCDEYPVLTMWWMRATAWAAPGLTGFYWANVLGLAVLAVAVTVCLYLMAGRRALFFAAAPTLAVYSFINWDLLPVAFATAATLAYFRRRDRWAGVLLGLGAAAKLYPILLVFPFVAGRFREGKKDDGIGLAWAAAGAWLVVNLPFALAAPSGWWEFFEFNSLRPTDFDSLWYQACDLATGNGPCSGTRLVNAASLALFLGLATVAWVWKSRRHPNFPAWTFGMPLLILFLLTNKVYSPQYSLWLLPWFALTLPRLGWFIAFELADVAVFASRFSWFGNLTGTGGTDVGWFRAAIALRAIILVGCLFAWLRRSPERLPTELPPESSRTERDPDGIDTTHAAEAPA